MPRKIKSWIIFVFIIIYFWMKKDDDVFPTLKVALHILDCQYQLLVVMVHSVN